MEKANRRIVFVLPFVDMVSDYVRALCLKDYQPPGWIFTYLKGDYPKVFNFYPARFFYRFYFYLTRIVRLTHKKRAVVYFITPQNPFLLWALRNIFNRIIVIDIQDGIHSKELLGYRKSIAIIKNSDYVVFESLENAAFWQDKINTPFSVVEDTPQHECVYLDFDKRDKVVIWIGSIHTVKYLSDFISYFKLFSEMGYMVRLLGCTPELSSFLNKENIAHSYLEHYDSDTLSKELRMARISFIPMTNTELFKFRGNLKAKISMAYGCLTIASDLDMHKRLIINNKTGYLFNNLSKFEKILSKLHDLEVNKNIAFSGNKYITENFERQRHVAQLISVANRL